MRDAVGFSEARGDRVTVRQGAMQAAPVIEPPPPAPWWQAAWVYRSAREGLGVLALALIAVIAPWIADDPLSFDPLERLRRPSGEFPFGTDEFDALDVAADVLGRDLPRACPGLRGRDRGPHRRVPDHDRGRGATIDHRIQILARQDQRGGAGHEIGRTSCRERV